MPRKKRISAKRRRKRGKPKVKKPIRRVQMDHSMEHFEYDGADVSDDGYVLVIPYLYMGYFDKFV